MRVVGVDLDLEAKYLGAAMLEPDVLRQHPLAIAIFSSEHTRNLLTALLSMAARGVEPSPISLDIELARLGYEKLRQHKLFEKHACLCPDIEAVAARLRELATLRVLHEKLTIAIGFAVEGDVLKVQAALREATDIADRSSIDRLEITGIGDAVDASREQVYSVQKGERVATMPSGIPDLDHDVGDLVVFAGDPSAGKSTTMLLAAITQANEGLRPGIVSLEDGRERWGRRAMWALTGIAVSSLKSGQLSAVEWSTINRTAGEDGTARKVRVRFAYPLGGTLDEVMACVRKMRHEHGCNIIYVDYLQAIAGGTGDDKQVRHHIRDCLESFRRELGSRGGPLTMIVGSQYKKREDDTRRPSNSDLYEAAYIHQKSDTILHLWRNAKGVRNAWLGKHKEDEQLLCELHIDGHTRRLVNPRLIDPDPQQKIPDRRPDKTASWGKRNVVPIRQGAADYDPGPEEYQDP